MNVHHNTVKRAAANGLVIERDDSRNIFIVRQFGSANVEPLASASDPKDALDLAILALAPAKAPKPPKAAKAKSTRKPKRRKASSEDGDEEDGEDEADDSRSLVKSKYREKYRPHKMTCGDQLAKRIQAEFLTVKDPDTKKMRLDFGRFVKFAQANDCWVEGYRSLKDRHGKRNNGLIRMNVINRLRAKTRQKGFEIKWDV